MSNDDGGRKAKRFDVELPSSNLTLLTWKSKSGSLVRKGETIAVAGLKGAASNQVSESTTSAPEIASSGQHKRPNRRRRMTPAASTIGSSAMASSASASTSAEMASYNPMANIQQRLAEKLSSESSKSSSIHHPSNNPPSTPSSESSVAKKNSEHNILAPATGILQIPSADTSSSPLVIGYIEECLHPAFLQGICVVCGEPMRRQEGDDEDDKSHVSLSVPVPSYPSYDSSPSTSTSNRPKTTQVTVSGGVTMTVSAEESRNMAYRDTARLFQQAKLSLVLDLDHTLVHATADPRAQQFHDRDDVRTLRLPVMEGMPPDASSSMPTHPSHGQNMFMQHHVKLRPHIKTFLQSVQPDYELTVYTAGTRQYAEEITIVLCRYMVGSTRDIDELERLSHHVYMAEMEYHRIQSLKDGSSNSNKDEEHNAVQDDDMNRKRKADSLVTCANNDADAEDVEDEERSSKKRKKVSFGVPKEEEEEEEAKNAVDMAETNKPPAKSDHMTKARLESLRRELMEANELEQKARELRQKLFGSRVFSRTDMGDLGRDVKSLKRIFPCGGTMAAVVDDREDVWANASDNSNTTVKGEPPDNLLLVRPYHWRPFIGFADVNNAAGEDLSGGHSGSGGDPEEKDVQLVWTSRILKGLHRRYYRQNMDNRRTVPELLAQMRSQVLRDSTMVLSGLVPLHKKSIDAYKARPAIVRYVQSLGAKLVERVEDGVTHVVAAKDGTDKCLAARKIPGCVLVKAAWLVECYWSMTRRDVKLHLLDGDEAVAAFAMVTQATKQPLQESKVDNSASTDASDTSSLGSQEDDDLAAALESEMMNS